MSAWSIAAKSAATYLSTFGTSHKQNKKELKREAAEARKEGMHLLEAAMLYNAAKKEMKSEARNEAKKAASVSSPQRNAWHDRDSIQSVTDIEVRTIHVANVRVKLRSRYVRTNSTA